MKNNRNNIILLSYNFAVFTAVCFLSLSFFSAQKVLAVEPFTNSSSEMDKIHYEAWAQDADLAITLDQHMYPALLASIQQFGKKKKIKIAVREGTCGISAGSLSNKAVDIAGFCCPPSDSDRSFGVNFHTIAIGAIAIYVNKENPINNMSLEEARGVFTGNITHWSSLKTDDGTQGPPYSIQPISRLHCKTRPGHWRLLLDNEELFSPRLIDVGSIEDVFRQVEGNPFSIGGFESLYMANEVYKTKTQLKIIKINNYRPSPENLLAGNFPLYFVFNITTWPKDKAHKELNADLIKYLRSEVEINDPKFGMISANKLIQNGWVFSGDELIAQPNK